MKIVLFTEINAHCPIVLVLKTAHLNRSAAVFESSVYLFTWPVTRLWLWACSSISVILYMFTLVFENLTNQTIRTDLAIIR